jgi:hypothetical protein
MRIFFKEDFNYSYTFIKDSITVKIKVLRGHDLPTRTGKAHVEMQNFAIAEI